MSRTTIKETLAEWWWQTRCWSTRLRLILRHRPLIICPFCKGRGGEMSGYEEPEWSECRCCDHHWNDLEDHGMEWFVGRVPVWVWVRAKLSIRCGMWECSRVRDLIRCKLGWHLWMNDNDWKLSKNGTVCCHCWCTRKLEASVPNPPARAGEEK